MAKPFAKLTVNTQLRDTPLRKPGQARRPRSSSKEKPTRVSVTSAEQDPGTAKDPVTGRRLSLTEGRRSIRTSRRTSTRSEPAGTVSGQVTKRTSITELMGQIRSSLKFGTTPSTCPTEQGFQEFQVEERQVQELMAAFEAGRIRAAEAFLGACTQALLSESFAQWVYIHKLEELRKSDLESDEEINAVSKKSDRLCLQWAFETLIFSQKMERTQGKRRASQKLTVEEVQTSVKKTLARQQTLVLQGQQKVLVGGSPTSPTSSVSLSELLACMRDPASPKTPFTPYSPIPAEWGDKDEFNVPKTPVIMAGRVEWTDISSATWV